MDSFERNLKKFRKERGLTLEELANRCNNKYGTSFNKSMISKWENGHRAHLSSVKTLSLFFGVSLNEMLGFNNEEQEDINNTTNENYKIPIIKTISVEEPALTDQNIIGYASVPPMFKISERGLKDLFYLQVKGDSMNIEYPDSSFVLIRRDMNIQNGDNAVFLIGNDNEATLKKAKIQDDILTLIPVSYNKNYLPRIIDMNKESVRIIGKVIGAFKYS